MDFLINIDVPDLERGIAFYRDAFGFELGRRLGPDFAELLGGPARVYLLLKDEDSLPFVGATTQRTFGPHWTPVHFDIVVEAIDVVLARAEAAGATRESEVQEEPYGKLALLRDPFGHGICLLEFNAQGYDAIASS